MINTYIADLGSEESAAISRKNRDGTYTIVLNGRYTAERLKEAYEHELGHINNGDLEKNISIQEAELRNRGIETKTEPTVFGIPLSEYNKTRQSYWKQRRRRLLAKYYKEKKRGEKPYWERAK